MMRIVPEAIKKTLESQTQAVSADQVRAYIRQQLDLFLLLFLFLFFFLFLFLFLFLSLLLSSSSSSSLLLLNVIVSLYKLLLGGSPVPGASGLDGLLKFL